MYEINVEAEFCAAHALMIAGAKEPVHGHNWRVTVTVGGPSLDPDGLLLDFHALEVLVLQLLAPFNNNNLNSIPPFDRLNPSAEHVALHIGERLGESLTRLNTQGNGVRLVCVRVTEAPGCSVVYRP